MDMKKAWSIFVCVSGNHLIKRSPRGVWKYDHQLKLLYNLGIVIFFKSNFIVLLVPIDTIDWKYVLYIIKDNLVRLVCLCLCFSFLFTTTYYKCCTVSVCVSQTSLFVYSCLWPPFLGLQHWFLLTSPIVPGLPAEISKTWLFNSLVSVVMYRKLSKWKRPCHHLKKCRLKSTENQVI